MEKETPQIGEEHQMLLNSIGHWAKQFADAMKAARASAHPLFRLRVARYRRALRDTVDFYVRYDGSLEQLALLKDGLPTEARSEIDEVL